MLVLWDVQNWEGAGHYLRFSKWGGNGRLKQQLLRYKHFMLHLNSISSGLCWEVAADKAYFGFVPKFWRESNADCRTFDSCPLLLLSSMRTEAADQRYALTGIQNSSTWTAPPPTGCWSASRPRSWPPTGQTPVWGRGLGRAWQLCFRSRLRITHTFWPSSTSVRLIHVCKRVFIRKQTFFCTTDGVFIYFVVKLWGEHSTNADKFLRCERQLVITGFHCPNLLLGVLTICDENTLRFFMYLGFHWFLPAFFAS